MRGVEDEDVHDGSVDSNIPPEFVDEYDADGKTETINGPIGGELTQMVEKFCITQNDDPVKVNTEAPKLESTPIEYVRGSVKYHTYIQFSQNFEFMVYLSMNI